MADITVTGKEAYFNENTTFFKDVTIYRNLNYDFRIKPLDVQDLNVFGNANFFGYDNRTNFQHKVRFENDIVVDKEIEFLRVGILTVSNRFDVGPGGSVLNATAETALVGIGVTDPTQDLHVRGSVRIEEYIYDSDNLNGGIGFYLSMDEFGIKWTVLEPTFTEGIRIFDQGDEIGVGNSFSGINFITNSGGTVNELVEATVNPTNPYVADITIKDFWTSNGADIYRNSNVGINNDIPTYTLDVTGTVRITEDILGERDLFLTRDAYITGFTTITGELLVTSPSKLFNTLSVASTTTLSSDLFVLDDTFIQNTLNVNNATNLNLTLTVANETQLNSTLVVEGETALNSTLTVAEATQLNSTLDVVGITNLQEDLNVFGPTFIDNTLSVSSNTSISGKLDVFGATRLYNTLQVDKSTRINENLYVVGLSTLVGDARLENNLRVIGVSNLEDDLNVGGITSLAKTLTVTESTLLRDSLDVIGITSLNKSLFVVGITTLNDKLKVVGDADLRSKLTVTGITSLGNTLEVAGDSLLKRQLTVVGITSLKDKLIVDGTTELNSTLDVFDATTLGNTLTVSGETNLLDNLTVEGATDLNSSLNVDGTTDLNSSLTVGGITDLNSTLTVDGSTELKSTLSVGPNGDVITTTGIGSVGIGTNNPDKDIELAKDVKFSQAIYDNNDNVDYRTNEYYEVSRSVLSTIGINTLGEIIEGRFFDAANLIRLNLDYIAKEAIGFITSSDYKVPKFSITTNDYESCKDDIKDILKAITFDITKGGNSASVGAGLSYYDGTTLLYIETPEVKQASIDAIQKAAEYARYVVNNATPPVSYQKIDGKSADAGGLLTLNKDFIAYEAVQRTLNNFPSLVIPGGNENCVDDIKLILDAIIYNIQYGGNNNVYDAAKFYIDNPKLLEGEIQESIYAYGEVSKIAIQVIRNQTVTKASGSFNTFTQVIDNSIIGDISGVPGVYQTSCATNDFTTSCDCSDQASAINSFVGIVTFAIGNSVLPNNRTIAGITSIRQVKDLTLSDDPAVGSNTDPDGCANVVSAIYSCVGIITSIIKDGPSAAPTINSPDGKVIWAPPGAQSKNTIWVSKYGNDHDTGKTEGSAKLTIGAAAEIAQPGDTIFVRPGIYVENNPVGLRTDVTVSGQDLRLVNVIPKNLGRDVFHVRRGCLIENLSFACESINTPNPGGGAVAFPPRDPSEFALSGYIAPGPTGEGPSGRWRSPYIRNCTNFMKESIGMKIDGNNATASTIGADLKCMVCDSFTQYNEAGVGVSITNNGYAQLVSIFTINCDIAIYCDTGGQCDLTNSNSSFGNFGLVADGLGALEFTAEVQQDTAQETDTVVFSAVTDRTGNIRKPYDGQALFFKIDVDGTKINTPLLRLGTVTVTNGGSGYSPSAPPNIVLIDLDNNNSTSPLGPEGIIAELSPTIDENTGEILAIDVINSGRNYLPSQNLAILIEGGVATAVPNMEPIYYTVEQSTNPTPVNNRDADAYNLITRNRELIKDIAIGKMINESGLPYDPDTTICERDIGLVLDAVCYNLKYGGNYKAYDAAKIYVDGGYVTAYKDATIYAFNVARDYAKLALNNQSMDPDASTYSSISQFIDNTVIPDPANTPGYDALDCADQRTTVDNLFAIITTAIQDEVMPVMTRTNATVGICTVTFNEVIPYLIDKESEIEMFRISRILTTGHSFEYIGTGTDINTSTPQKGGVPIQENQIVARNGAQIPFTSTNQKGNFEIGEGLVIDQTTNTIRGRDFSRAIQAEVTPLILALR